MILSCLAVSCSAKITVPVLVIANSYSLFSLDKFRTFAISIENDAFQQIYFQVPSLHSDLRNWDIY